jgi:hypothetical protein
MKSTLKDDNVWVLIGEKAIVIKLETRMLGLAELGISSI